MCPTPALVAVLASSSTPPPAPLEISSFHHPLPPIHFQVGGAVEEKLYKFAGVPARTLI